MKQGEISQKVRGSICRLASLAAGVLAARGTFAQQPVPQRVFAVSGQAAPGTEAGTVFGGLGVPGIGARGDVAFDVTLAGSAVNTYMQSSLWLVPSGAGSPVIGYRGTDATNAYRIGRGAPSVDGVGRVSFITSTSGVSVLAGSPGSYQTVFKSGAAAPGMPAGTTLQPDLLTFQPLVDRDGDVYIESGTSYTSPTLGGNQPGMFLSAGGGPLQLLTYGGAPAPGVQDQMITGFSHAGLGGGGHVAFAASTITSQNVGGRGVWAGTLGKLTRIAYAGMTAPGIAGDLRMNVFYGGPAINSSGATVFSVDLLAPSGGTRAPVAYLYDGGQLTPIGAPGTPVPALGDGYVLDYSKSAWITDRGVALIRGNAHGAAGAASVLGWFRWRAGDGVTPIVRDGMAAPQLGAGVTLTGTKVISFNEAGEALVRATLAGTGVDSTNNDTLWAADPLGRFSLVARTGSAVGIGGGGERVVRTIGVSAMNFDQPPGFTAIPMPAALSDSGQVAYGLGFTDGSSANLLATLPSVIAGDVNNDLVVDLKDFDVLYRHLGQAGDRAVGDLDYDGVVGFSDYQVFQRNFGRSIDGGGVTGVPEEVAGMVPEPGVVAAGAVVVAGRRRRAAR